MEKKNLTKQIYDSKFVEKSQKKYDKNIFISSSHEILNYIFER